MLKSIPDTSPSTSDTAPVISSVSVAPASVYVPPTFTVTASSPLSIRPGYVTFTTLDGA